MIHGPYLVFEEGKAKFWCYFDIDDQSRDFSYYKFTDQGWENSEFSGTIFVCDGENQAFSDRRYFHLENNKLYEGVIASVLGQSKQLIIHKPKNITSNDSFNFRTLPNPKFYEMPKKFTKPSLPRSESQTKKATNLDDDVFSIDDAAATLTQQHQDLNESQKKIIIDTIREYWPIKKNMSKDIQVKVLTAILLGDTSKFSHDEYQYNNYAQQFRDAITNNRLKTFPFKAKTPNLSAVFNYIIALIEAACTHINFKISRPHKTRSTKWEELKGTNNDSSNHSNLYQNSNSFLYGIDEEDTDDEDLSLAIALSLAKNSSQANNSNTRQNDNINDYKLTFIDLLTSLLDNITKGKNPRWTHGKNTTPKVKALEKLKDLMNSNEVWLTNNENRIKLLSLIKSICKTHRNWAPMHFGSPASFYEFNSLVNSYNNYGLPKNSEINDYPITAIDLQKISNENTLEAIINFFDNENLGKVNNSI